SLALSDIFRGAVFLILSSAFVYLLATKKLSLKIAGILLVILVCSDLIPVGKRYFNNDDFQSKFRANSNVFEPSAADNFILEDKDPNFRVINLASPQGFMSDARDSYFHKSLGGYHGAKLKRYN